MHEAQQEATQQVESQSQQSPKQQQKLQDQKKFLKSTASDPRLVKLENRISNTHGVKRVRRHLHRFISFFDRFFDIVVFKCKIGNQLLRFKKLRVAL